jgi:hypothetical protein
MERAFKFLKRTSLSGGAVGEGAGVTVEESGGVVATEDAVGEAPPAGETPGGVSSCAEAKAATQIEASETKNEDRAVMVDHFNQSCTLGDARNIDLCSSL